MDRRRAAWGLVCLVVACTGPAKGDPIVVDSDLVEPSTLLPEACPTEAAVVRPARHWTPWQLRRVAEDLLGEDASDLIVDLPPADGAWEGLASAQAISPAHVEAWSDFAERLSARLLAREPRLTRWEVEAMGLPAGAVHGVASEPDAGWWAVDGDNTVVTLPITLTAPFAGSFEISLRTLWLAGWEWGGIRPPRLVWQVGAQRSPELALSGSYDSAELVSWTTTLPAGPTEATLEIYLQPWPGGEIGPTYYAIGLDWLELSGPTDDPFATDSPARRRWVRCDPEEVGAVPCATEVLEALVRRVWRRPLQAEERDTLLGLVELGLADGGFDDGLQLAVRAVLLSPHFLLHVDEVADVALGGVRPADPWELASRLALTLWGTTPDEALLDCAAGGGLTPDLTDAGPCGLAAQIDRLLADPRADAVTRDFARQWLALDLLARATRDPAHYPTYDAELGALMAEETYALVAHAASSPAVPLRSLIDSSVTWADDRVAGLYGLPPGAEERTLTDRRGLLGHASILTLTSQPGRTSPVKRGQWVLDRLLCDPVDPPPDGIPSLDEEMAIAGDLRSLMEAHSSNPACAYCHDRLDPLGLALEGLDAIGQRRDQYEDGSVVDDLAVLPGGAEVDGQVELALALAEDPATEACILRHLATWALALPAVDLPTCELERAGRPHAAEATNLHDALRALASSGATTQVRAPEAP